MDSKKLVRVLVADDNHDAADSLVTLLEVRGFEAVAAYDGEHAVTVFRAGGIDAAVLDVDMPKMNGFQVAGAMRSEGFCGLMIAYTGRVHLENAIVRAGFDHHLTKPAEIDQIIELLAMQEVVA